MLCLVCGLCEVCGVVCLCQREDVFRVLSRQGTKCCKILYYVMRSSVAWENEFYRLFSSKFDRTSGEKKAEKMFQ